MKKFLRTVFSGYGLVAFILIIELLVIVFLQFFLDDVLETTGLVDAEIHPYITLVYAIIKIITFIIAFILFFRIINSDMQIIF